MLQEEVSRLARAVHYLPEEQAKDILDLVVERVKGAVPAIISDIWLRGPVAGGGSILKLFASKADDPRPHPGDVIVTGTPGGVGARRNPPVWMKPGDTVEVEVSKVGVLVNTIKVG